MNKKLMENNKVELHGIVYSGPMYSHEILGERFYKIYLEIKRTSGVADILPVIASERIGITGLHVGREVYTYGQIRTFNEHREVGRNKLVLSVFALEIDVVEAIEGSFHNNYIYLQGYICKPPIYRKTPLGREIADLLLAVNRSYGKSDYIPCICWGRNARFAEKFQVGDQIQFWGRIQSREYQKKISEYETEKRVAYEVSVSRMEAKDEE